MTLDWSVTIIDKLKSFQPVIVYRQKKEIRNGNLATCTLKMFDFFIDDFECCWEEKSWTAEESCTVFCCERVFYSLGML